MAEERPAKILKTGKLRVGFICGKEDGDLVEAPGLPKAHHRRGEKSRQGAPLCHSDVAIWWYAKSRYGDSVEADLITGPGEVTAARLEANDVNLLLGWDAVSAQLEEADGTGRFESGHGDAMAALLGAPASRVLPPASVQDLCNAKGAYILEAERLGVPVAPTAVYECAGGSAKEGAAFAARVARERGWKRFIAKPSPSSWSRGVEQFTTSAVGKNDAKLVAYFEELAYPKSNNGAKQIIVQRHLGGLANAPETRCFFFGGDFLYAVANSKHAPGKPVELTSCPESASSSALPAKHWRPHAALARTVVDTVLPRFETFGGGTFSCKVPWLVRVDVGTHAACDVANGCAADAPDKVRKRRVCFVNEIETVPTLYLDGKFKHERDFLGVYARGFLRTAFEAAGRAFPEPDAPPSPRVGEQLDAAPRHNSQG